MGMLISLFQISFYLCENSWMFFNIPNHCIALLVYDATDFTRFVVVVYCFLSSFNQGVTAQSAQSMLFRKHGGDLLLGLAVNVHGSATTLACVNFISVLESVILSGF